MAKKNKGRKGDARKMGKKSSARTKGHPGMALLGLGVGVLSMALVDTQLLKKVGNGLKGGIELVAGGALAWKAGNPFLKGLGGGIFSWGAVRGVSALTGMTISGVGCPSVNGYRDVPAIAGNGIQRFPQPAAVGSARTRAAAMSAAGVM